MRGIMFNFSVKTKIYFCMAMIGCIAVNVIFGLLIYDFLILGSIGSLLYLTITFLFILNYIIYRAISELIKMYNKN